MHYCHIYVEIMNCKAKSSILMMPFQQAQAQFAQASTPMPAITEGSYQPQDAPAETPASSEYHTHYFLKWQIHENEKGGEVEVYAPCWWGDSEASFSARCCLWRIFTSADGPGQQVVVVTCRPPSCCVGFSSPRSSVEAQPSGSDDFTKCRNPTNNNFLNVSPSVD